MASSSVGGLSGAFIPVSEDLGMIEAVQRGSLSLEKLGSHDLRMFRRIGYDSNSGSILPQRRFRRFLLMKPQSA